MKGLLGVSSHHPKEESVSPHHRPSKGSGDPWYMDSGADTIWARPINGQHAAVDSSSQETSMQSDQTPTGSARCRHGHVKDSHYASPSLSVVTLEPLRPSPVIGHVTSTVDYRTQYFLCILTSTVELKDHTRVPAFGQLLTDNALVSTVSPYVL